MPTRTIKMQIVELDREHYTRLRDLSRQMRELHNFVWRQWESWHTQQGTAERVRALIAADNAWKVADKTSRGKRPKWDVKPWPNEFGKLVYHATARRFPGLNSRVTVLALQKIRQTVCTKNSSSKGGLKWWVAIMLDLDGRATHLRPCPIPLETEQVGRDQNLRASRRVGAGRSWKGPKLESIAQERSAPKLESIAQKKPGVRSGDRAKGLAREGGPPEGRGHDLNAGDRPPVRGKRSRAADVEKAVGYWPSAIGR